MLRFIKNWTLPLAMLAGVIGYFCFSELDFLAPTKPVVKVAVSFLTPFLIFSQLLLTFCKVEVKELTPGGWHGWLLLCQLVSAAVVAGVLSDLPYGYSSCSGDRQVRRKCSRTDDVYVSFQFAGGCFCSTCFPFGGAVDSRVYDCISLFAG